jgi:glutamyl-tRNA reductase
VNFHTAPLEAREAVCLDESGQRAVLNHLKIADESLEAIVLCTCNRTEIYVHYPDGHKPQILVEKALFDVVPTALISWRQHRQLLEDAAAVEHLFSVAAGLESQMLGENQIVRQLKDAYSLSIECQMSRFFFHKLMHAAFRASKAVRQTTKITCGAVSLSMAAIEVVRTKINLCGANVLLVGAGENATLAAKYLQKENIGKLTIANRTLSSARRLAGQFKNAEAISIQQVGEFLADADVVIFSTASSDPVLTAQEAGYYLAQRKTPILMIDLAVPRDVEPQVGELANVELINIEHLHLQVEKNRQARAVWIEPARNIIDQHTEQFTKWLASLDTAATVAQLTDEILSEAQRYTGRYRRYFAKKDQKRLEQFAEGLARKLMHRPIQYLKDKDIDKAHAAELVSNLFLSTTDKKAKS